MLTGGAGETWLKKWIRYQNYLLHTPVEWELNNTTTVLLQGWLWH